MLREPQVDFTLMGRVLINQGLRWHRKLEGRGYDIRPVRPDRAGTWLLDVLTSFEERTGRKPTRFWLSGSDLLILD